MASTPPDLLPAALALLPRVAANQHVPVAGLSDRDLDLITVGIRCGIAATAIFATGAVDPEPEPVDGPPCLGTVA